MNLQINVINRYEKPLHCCTEKGEDVSSVKTEYEKVVAEFEEKLNNVKLELEIANKKKKNLKEKFKRFDISRITKFLLFLL